jgi:hypothetical protein
MTATVDILHPDRPKRGAHRGVEPDGNDRDRPARRVRVGRAHLVEATIPGQQQYSGAAAGLMITALGT